MSKLLEGLQDKGFNLSSIPVDELIECWRNGEQWRVYMTEDYSSVAVSLCIPMLFITLTDDEEFTNEEIELLKEDITSIGTQAENILEVFVPLSWID
ncbi:MAG: hypothetical protein ACKPFF_11740 [Planktothrix sp.]